MEKWFDPISEDLTLFDASAAQTDQATDANDGSDACFSLSDVYKSLKGRPAAPNSIIEPYFKTAVRELGTAMQACTRSDYPAVKTNVDKAETDLELTRLFVGQLLTGKR